MTSEIAYKAIWTILGLAVIWWMFVCLWQRFCLDRLRENLFELRDRLFDLGDEGKVKFENRAYTHLRTLINNSIRHGHTHSFLGTLFLLVSLWKNRYFNKTSNDLENGWKASLAVQDPEVAEQLKELKLEYHKIILTHYMSTSALFWVVSLGLGFVLLFLMLHTKASDTLERWFNGFGRRIDAVSKLTEESDRGPGQGDQNIALA